MNCLRRGTGQVGVLLAALAVAQPAAAAGYVTLGAAPAYFSGPFGGSSSIGVYDLPLTLRYHAANWQVSAELPLLAITGAGALVTGGNPRGVRAGLGDLWLGGDLRLNRPQGWQPAVIPYARLKIPTASAAHGFGTGQPDAEIGSRVEWRVAAPLYVYGQAGYRFDGRKAGLGIQNAPVLAGGVALLVTPHSVLSLAFEARGPLQSGAGETETALAAFSTPLSTCFSLQLFALRGFTPANAAYGGGLGITARLP
jgi:hypothetical protein